jgi:AcrR family transcriptional regulator
MPAPAVESHQQARICRAMVEVVAERGYAAVTVRELARLAGVSTRTFYQRYPSKEECLLHTQQLAMRRWICLADSQAEDRDWEQGVSAVIRTLLDEWSRDRQAARFALVEAHACGAAAQERIRRAERAIEMPFARAFDRATEGERMTPLLVEAVAAGVAGIARSRLLAGRGDQLRLLRTPLTRWALSYPSSAVAQLPELDRISAARPSRSYKPASVAPASERDLLLSAVYELVAADGLEGLTDSKVLNAAGVQRRALRANFSGVEDCVATAFEVRAEEAIERAERSAARGATPEGSIHRAMRALCAQVAGDPVFAGLCFGEVATLGPRGAECRERFMASMRRIVSDTALGTGTPSEQVAIEASVAAVWALIERKVLAGQARGAPGIVGTLAYLLLAPIAGVPTALEAMQDEQLRVTHI